MASLGSLICVLFFLIRTTVAEIRFSEIRSDSRFTIPLDEFGFTHTGFLELNVTQISFDDQTLKNSNTDLSQIGFFLSSRDSWLHILEQIADGDLKCPLKSDFIKVVFTFDKLQSSDSYFSNISVTNPNQLTLLFGNCVPDLHALCLDFESFESLV
ncbi:hypothetical protein LOK49_LG04G00540 [Camellia lanceoleosa]|uniref:Uncharacterized protein n=1 Tax=Camellia lanceoleosa TaxID=1840588 RepID=A0ACC0I4E2_9ERIC|nr:hypothetical protein LOK49_LG04G00540 [Camellia lanceoleosa]